MLNTLIHDASWLVTGVVALRTLPFVVFAMVRGGRPRGNALLLLAVLTLTWTGVWRESRAMAEGLLLSVAILAVVQVAGVLVHDRLLSKVRWSRSARITVAVAIVLLVPAAASVLSPTDVAVVMVVLSVEYALAFASLLIERGGVAEDHKLRDRLVFLLVDPEIVYLQRSTVREERIRGSLRRLLWGAATLAAASVLSSGYAWIDAVLEGRGHRGLVSLVVQPALAAWSLYFMHAGLASVQIGAAGLVGMDVRERYARPFWARSPTELWARWNIWMADWVNRYLFLPITLRLRRTGRVSPEAAWAFGAILAFTVVGLIHGSAAWAMTRGSHRELYVGATATGLFVAFGILTVAWRLTQLIGTRIRWPGIAGALVPGILARAGMWSLILSFAPRVARVLS